MGKLVAFCLKYPQVRLKSAIYTVPLCKTTSIPVTFVQEFPQALLSLYFSCIFRSCRRYFFSLNKDIGECGNVVLISKFITNCKNFLK